MVIALVNLEFTVAEVRGRFLAPPILPVRTVYEEGGGARVPPLVLW